MEWYVRVWYDMTVPHAEPNPMGSIQLLILAIEALPTTSESELEPLDQTSPAGEC